MDQITHMAAKTIRSLALIIIIGTESLESHVYTYVLQTFILTITCTVYMYMHYRLHAYHDSTSIALRMTKASYSRGDIRRPSTTSSKWPLNSLFSSFTRSYKYIHRSTHWRIHQLKVHSAHTVNERLTENMQLHALHGSMIMMPTISNMPDIDQL